MERVVQSTVGLTDPANRLESWGEDEEEEEEEERLKMAVTDRVLPYDLLHSVEAFYWSCVCRSVSPSPFCWSWLIISETGR